MLKKREPKNENSLNNWSKNGAKIYQKTQPWSSEILKFRSPELLKFWSAEVQKFWSFEVIKFGSPEVLKFWSSEVLKFWSLEVPKFIYRMYYILYTIYTKSYLLYALYYILYNISERRGTQWRILLLGAVGCVCVLAFLNLCHSLCVQALV